MDLINNIFPKRAETAVQKMWDEEKKLPDEERRKRYHENYIPKEKIIQSYCWNIHFPEPLEKGLENLVLIKKTGINNNSKDFPDPMTGFEFKTTSTQFSKLSPDQIIQISKKIGFSNEDITKLEVDAIVNAANTTLLGGGGIDGAIHKAAGKKLREECVLIRDSIFQGIQIGKVKITRGYNLPAKYVIHTVAPKDESIQGLETCYYNCLTIAQAYKIRTLVFCGLGTGVYGFNMWKAAHVAIQVVLDFLSKEENLNSFDLVIFNTWSRVEIIIYQLLLSWYLPLKEYSQDSILQKVKDGFEKLNKDNINLKNSTNIKNPENLKDSKNMKNSYENLKDSTNKNSHENLKDSKNIKNKNDLKD